MDSGWQQWRVAVAFLTRLPVAAPAAPLAGAMGIFPLVGAGIGLAGGLAYGMLLALDLPPLLAALAAVALMVLVTGGLHEDGLADTADGLGGGGAPRERLAIMRDSRIGTFGTIALILALSARAAALATLGGAEGIAACVAAGALSRAFFPAIMVALAPARADGLGAGAGRPTEAGLVTALALGYLLAAIAAGPLDAILLLAATAAAAALVAIAAERRLGGFTGDVLGAAQQAAEVAALALATTLLGDALP